MAVTPEDYKEYYQKAIEHRIDLKIKEIYNSVLAECEKDPLKFDKDKFSLEATNKTKEHVNIFNVVYNRAKQYFGLPFNEGCVYPLTNSADCGAYCKQVLNNIGISWPERYVPYDICYAKNNNNGINWQSSGGERWITNLWNENIWNSGDCDISNIKTKVGDLIVVRDEGHVIMSDGDYGCFDAGSVAGVSHRPQWRPFFAQEHTNLPVTGYIKTGAKIAEYIKSNNIDEYDTSFDKYIGDKVEEYLNKFLKSDVYKRKLDLAYQELVKEHADDDFNISREEFKEEIAINPNVQNFAIEFGWTSERSQELINEYIEEQNLYEQYEEEIALYKEIKNSVDSSIFDDLAERVKKNNNFDKLETEEEYINSAQNDTQIAKYKTEATSRVSNNLKNSLEAWIDEYIADSYDRYKALYDTSDYSENSNLAFSSAYGNITKLFVQNEEKLPENSFVDQIIQDTNVQTYQKSYSWSDERVQELIDQYLEETNLYSIYENESEDYIDLKKYFTASIPNINIVQWTKEQDDKAGIKIAKSREEFIKDSLKNEKIEELQNNIPAEMNVAFKESLTNTIKKTISDKYEEYKNLFNGLDIDSIYNSVKAEIENNYIEDVAKDWGTNPKSDYKNQIVDSIYNKAIDTTSSIIESIDSFSKTRLLALFTALAAISFSGYIIKTKENHLSLSEIGYIDVAITNQIFEEKKQNINIEPKQLAEKVVAAPKVKEEIVKCENQIAAERYVEAKVETEVVENNNTTSNNIGTIESDQSVTSKAYEIVEEEFIREILNNYSFLLDKDKFKEKLVEFAKSALTDPGNDFQCSEKEVESFLTTEIQEATYKKYFDRSLAKSYPKLKSLFAELEEKFRTEKINNDSKLASEEEYSSLLEKYWIDNLVGPEKNYTKIEVSSYINNESKYKSYIKYKEAIEKKTSEPTSDITINLNLEKAVNEIAENYVKEIKDKPKISKSEFAKELKKRIDKSETIKTLLKELKLTTQEKEWYKEYTTPKGEFVFQ